MVQHALALATQKQHGDASSWWNEDLLQYHSGSKRLRDLAKDGGTAWIIKSSPIPGGGTRYSLHMCLRNCTESNRTEGSGGDIRHNYGVIGDKKLSRVYAPKDAENLLMSLRFNPKNEIDRRSVIGQSLQTARLLNSDDVILMEKHQKDVDRWSVFISYRRNDEKIAKSLSESLAKKDVAVYRDIEGLKPGDKWWPNLQKAISRSQFLVLLIGPDTHNSQIVRDEIDHALENNKEIIPIIAGGDISNFPNVQSFHGFEYKESEVSNIAARIAQKIS